MPRPPSLLLTLLLSPVCLAADNPPAQPPADPHRQFLHLLKSGSPEKVRAALDAGADANPPAIPSIGGPPLVNAVNACSPMGLAEDNRIRWPSDDPRARDHVAVIKLLLDRGADPNAGTAGQGCTPLVFAVVWQLPEVAELLIDRGAKPEPPTGPYPLHMAAASGKTEMVALLLHKGADPNAAKRPGQTPLFLARKHPHNLILITLLLNAGAKAPAPAND